MSNLDSIQFTVPKKKILAPKITSQVKTFAPLPPHYAFVRYGIFNFSHVRKYASLPFALLAAVLFFSGAFVVWSTSRSDAQNFSSVAQASDPYANFTGPVVRSEPLSMAEFTNTSISLLNDYLEGPSTEDQLVAKRELLRQYLEYKKSPFAKDTQALDTLVRVPHMKIILEIAFAESTLGKKCVDNNCSNIGSAPDRPYWRQYASLSNWILDFDRLLEKRYKDWTLKEMCGVYVQPCNDNWLAATNQVRQELAEWGID